MVKGNYFQMKNRGFEPPSWVEVRKNTRGRGAEYLYEEDEVRKAVLDFKQRIVAGFSPKKGPMQLSEKVKIILTKAPKTRMMLQKELGIDSSSHRMYGKLNITLNALMDDGEVIRRDVIGGPPWYYFVPEVDRKKTEESVAPPPPLPPGKFFERPEPVEQIELKPQTPDGKKPPNIPDIEI